MNTLAHILSFVLIPLFFVGMVGSVIVVMLTIFNDLQLIFTSDEDKEGPEL